MILSYLVATAGFAKGAAIGVGLALAAKLALARQERSRT